MAISSKLLTTFNFILFFLGLLMFFTSIFVNQTFQDAGWGIILFTGAVWVGIFAGVFMVILSVIGCYAARYNQKCLLFWYMICMLILCIIQIVAAVVFFDYSNRFQAAFAVPSSQLTNPEDVFLNNAVLSVFSKCCSGCNTAQVGLFTDGLVSNCTALSAPGDDFVAHNKGWTGTRCSIPAQQALFPTAEPIFCDSPGPCYGSQVNLCWKYLTTNNKAALSFPPYYVDAGFCNVLTGLTAFGRPIVGFPQRGGCGRGSAQEFIEAITEYFVPKMLSAGIVVAIIALFTVLAIAMSCYMWCCVRKAKVEGEEDGIVMTRRMERANERRAREAAMALS